MLQDSATIAEFQELAGKTIEQIQFVEDRSMPFRMLEIHFTDGTTLNVEFEAKCKVLHRNYNEVDPVTLRDYGTFGDFVQ